MILKDIIKECKFIKVVGDTNIEVNAILLDSRSVGRGDMFVAVCGTQTDGHNFIAKAIELGAVSILCSVLPNQINENVTYIVVSDTSEAMAIIAKSFYSNPTSKLKLVGITGTNGKTSSATLLYQMFTNLGYKCGLISTITYIVGDKEFNSSLTTPDVITLNNIFCQMVEQGCVYCFMEVSSHAITQHRINGLEFDIALFTNITHDHLDYHKTFDAYISAKKSFFDKLDKNAVALYNSDDRNGSVMVQNCSAKRKSFSLRGASDYRCRVVEEHLDGMLIEINKQEIWVKFLGQFNAYNLLGVYAVADELGLSKTEILVQLSVLMPVSGRFEIMQMQSGSVAVVDYAHTPDALDNVLRTICEIRMPSQKIITVIGCGGDRDKTKRPLMARIAVRNSDFTIFTSDNPRSESTDAIIEDMMKGIEGVDSSRYIVISSREQAIKMGVMMVKQSGKAILLIAGKGHEKYQEINGVKIHFDDKEEITKNL